MLYGRYLFQLVFNSLTLLPPFKGSTFRGVFGIALKKVICPLKKQDCTLCLLRGRCIYLEIFEKPPATDKPGIPSPPHPFILEPPLSYQTEYQPGEGFALNLILLGTANENLPYFVYAVEQMGRQGIGKKTAGKRSTFRLKEIRNGDRLVYDSAKGDFYRPEPQQLALENFEREIVGQRWERLSLRLLTPLRLKFENRLQAELPFHVLIRAALRRIAQLNQHFGDGEPKLDYTGLVARAHEVKIERADLRWFDWKRYSNRQEQSMLMGGMIGEITYRGDLTEFLPLLRYCEKVHLGKATTFGLGQIQVCL